MTYIIEKSFRGNGNVTYYKYFSHIDGFKNSFYPSHRDINKYSSIKEAQSDINALNLKNVAIVKIKDDAMSKLDFFYERVS